MTDRLSVRFSAFHIAAAAAFCAGSALAQQAPAIERIKLTDNQATCAQLHAESGDMDKAMADARAGESQGNVTTTAGAVGGVAAQVATRTGLFGQMGGLFGQIAGSLAAQTAATRTQQSGPQTVQQAQERGRQAMARKEQVNTLFVSKGCKVSDLAYNPPASQAPQTQSPMQLAAAPAAIPAPAPTTPIALAAPPITLPALDPDLHFKGKMGGTFGKNVTEVLPNSKRVAVAGFRVAFVTHNSVSAKVRASYMPGRDISGASSTLNLALAGVDAATLQALTDRAYADFIAQLKLAGREVVPLEDMREFFSGVNPATAKPYVKELNGQTAQVFAPGGTPLWFSQWDGAWNDRGLLDQSNYRRMAEYAAKWQAITVAPLVVINFARMMSSGNTSGFTSRAAETGADLGMIVTAFNTTYIRSDEFRNGLTMKGDEGGIQMSAPVLSATAFGDVKEVSSDNNAAIKGVFDVLGQSGGLANAGGAARSTSTHVAQTSNEAYGAAAHDVLGKASGTFARLFQKYPAP